MKILIDFFPILLFFGAYKMFNIYTATGVLMAATVLQMGLIYAIDRKLQAMHKITLVLILLFGTLTLVLQDDRFIKWKPTVLYGAMALALAIGAHLPLAFAVNCRHLPSFDCVMAVNRGGHSWLLATSVKLRATSVFFG